MSCSFPLQNDNYDMCPLSRIYLTMKWEARNACDGFMGQNAAAVGAPQGISDNGDDAEPKESDIDLTAKPESSNFGWSRRLKTVHAQEHLVLMIYHLESMYFILQILLLVAFRLLHVANIQNEFLVHVFQGS